MNNLKRYEMPFLMTLAILILLLLFGVSYAYFKTTINNMESASTIAFTSGEMTINYEGNTEAILASNIIPGWSSTKKFTLSGKNTAESANSTENNMHYKIVLAIEQNTFTPGALTYKLSPDSSSSSNGKMSPETNGSIEQKGNQVLGSGYFSKTKEYVNHVYNLTIAFPSTDYNQSADNGKSFAAHLTIQEDKITILETITNLDLTNNSLEIDNTPDKNIRFVGNNPKNYIKFNNEIWRIIGVFNNIITVDNNNNEKTETLIKIIRNESLGKYSWDSSEETVNRGYGVNEWSQADLMNELNSDYINPAKARGTTMWYSSDKNTKKASYDFSKNIKSSGLTKIANVKWNTGRTSSGESALNSYNQERSTVSISEQKDGIPRNTIWIGKVGLMYPSDFGYATTNADCRNKLNSSTNNIYNCQNDNWLYSGKSEWMLSPSSGSTYYAYSIDATGEVHYEFAYADEDVKPVVFLKSDVIVSGGTGENENTAYIID